MTPVVGPPLPMFVKQTAAEGEFKALGSVPTYLPF
jgi:hypothetical protein